MRLALRVHPEAAAELLAAAQWYETEHSSLGADFLTEVSTTEQYVLDWPDASPVSPGWVELPVIRTAAVRVFPYRVLYYRTSSSVVIVAYAHHRRRPRCWQHRLHD